jgi:hypothetical protein
MSRISRLVAISGALVLASPAVVLACPMCFDGGNSNQSAFLWGSVFLMIVPVTAIGSLLYWAYRRSRALEQPPPAPPTPAPDAPRPALHVVRER